MLNGGDTAFMGNGNSQYYDQMLERKVESEDFKKALDKKANKNQLDIAT